MQPKSPRQLRIIKLLIIAFIAGILLSYENIEHVINLFIDQGTQVFGELNSPWKKEEAADIDTAVADVKTGDVYRPGENGEKNDKEAAGLELRAANQDHEEKSRAVYHDAEGVMNADKEEFVSLRQTAEQGDAMAQFEMGEAYHDGAGVTADDKEAVNWYIKAAEQGQAYAEDRLGTAYHEGLGVKKDDVAAINWWRKAAAQGNTHAQEMLEKYAK